MGKAFVFLNNLDTINICNLCRIGFKDFTSVDFGHGLLKCGSTIVPFMDHFPRSGRLYQLMTTKLSEISDNFV